MQFSFPPVLFFGLAPFQSSHFIFPTQNSTPNMSEFNAPAPSSLVDFCASRVRTARRCLSIIAPTRWGPGTRLPRYWRLDYWSHQRFAFRVCSCRSKTLPFPIFVVFHFGFTFRLWEDSTDRLDFCDCTTYCETTDWGEYALSFSAFFSRKFAIATSLPKTERHASDHLLNLRFSPSAICSLFIFLKPSRSFPQSSNWNALHIIANKQVGIEMMACQWSELMTSWFLPTIVPTSILFNIQ